MYIQNCPPVSIQRFGEREALRDSSRARVAAIGGLPDTRAAT
jgi:hypothetical protein